MSELHYRLINGRIIISRDFFFISDSEPLSPTNFHFLIDTLIKSGDGRVRYSVIEEGWCQFILGDYLVVKTTYDDKPFIRIESREGRKFTDKILDRDVMYRILTDELL